jgi:hypothetical protein
MPSKTELENQVRELEKDKHHCTVNHREMETTLGSVIKFPDELSQCIEDFIDVLATGECEGGAVKIDNRHEAWYPPRGKGVIVPLDYERTQALQQLYTDLRRAFGAFGERRYREGLRDGQNILVQLASGEMTISDFNASSDKRDQLKNNE